LVVHFCFEGFNPSPQQYSKYLYVAPDIMATPNIPSRVGNCQGLEDDTRTHTHTHTHVHHSSSLTLCLAVLFLSIRVSTPPPSYPSLHPPSSSSFNFKKGKTDRNTLGRQTGAWLADNTQSRNLFSAPPTGKKTIEKGDKKRLREN
jgi:hypothetical protein